MKFKIYFIISIVSFFDIKASEISADRPLWQQVMPSLIQWYETLKDRNPSKFSSMALPISFERFQLALFECKDLNETLLKKTGVVGLTNDQFIADSAREFHPFAQKLMIPAESKVYFWGDLHGDVAFVVNFLKRLYDTGVIDEQWKIVNSKNYFVFLGDYTDRGCYGTEVLYSLALLKLQNPDNVILVRGNHEDINQNIRSTPSSFLQELLYKYAKTTKDKQKNEEKINKIKEFINDYLPLFYNTLPVVVYIGIAGTNDFLQCCHGGMEIGFNPGMLFAAPCPLNCAVVQEISEVNPWKYLNELVPKEAIEKNGGHDCSQQLALDEDLLTNWFFGKVTFNNIFPEDIGFMWSDFSAQLPQKETRFSNRGGKILSYGSILTQKILESYGKYKVVGVIRGHQHNSSMPGLLHPNNDAVYVLPWSVPIYTTFATGSLGTEAASYLCLDIQQWHMTSSTYDIPARVWRQQTKPFYAWQNRMEPT